MPRNVERRVLAPPATLRSRYYDDDHRQVHCCHDRYKNAFRNQHRLIDHSWQTHRNRLRF